MKHLRQLVAAALMLALCCVATMVLRIPSPIGGYVNLGDCMVLLSGWLLGPWWGFAAGGGGSALADFLSGYAHYVPGTLVIKGGMAVLAALLAGSRHGLTVRRGAAGLAAELWMIAGYFGYSALLLGKGLAALSSVPGNLAQAAVGLTAGLLLEHLLEQSGIRRVLRIGDEQI